MNQCMEMHCISMHARLVYYDFPRLSRALLLFKKLIHTFLYLFRLHRLEEISGRL